MNHDDRQHSNAQPDAARSDTRPIALRALSRARFLAWIAGGAALALGAKGALGSLSEWRFNTVERPVPVFDRSTYRLIVDGLVERPFTLDYDELRALPAVRQVSDFHCVEGWGVDDVRWDGVRMQSIIERARPTAEAKFVTFHSMGDIYRDSLSMAQANFGDTMIAYDMDRAPLSKSHGSPLRLVMPQMYGYKGPKWLTRIEFRPRRDTGFWEQRGWAVDAWLKL
jgi:DMSO/TMAO reductase YedYZ molybdopterin-dependent catalytic subunit